MINLLLGAPGSGKSYEAVTYHILPALDRGRAVVTNLPLNVQEIKAIVPNVDSLLIIKVPTLQNPRPFSLLEDYDSTWKDDVSGQGCLYVIDECHFALPRGATRREVEEWYSMHRHLGVDVLLITQSYGKVSKPIIDLIQAVYRVRKNIALGSSTSYVRKVQDGVRGEVVNTSIRKYNSKFFKYYKSHTLSISDINESGSSDIKPIWSHWSFKLALVLFVFMIYWVTTHNVNPLAPPTPKPVPVKPPPQQPVQQAVVKPLPASALPAQLPPPVPVQPSKPQVSAKDEDHPFYGLSLHLSGYVARGKKRLYQIVAAYNGQPSFLMTSDDLIASGYSFDFKTECLAHISFGDFARYITCDSPKAGAVMAGSNVSSQTASDFSASPSHPVVSAASDKPSMGYGYPSSNPGGLGF